MEKKNKFLGLRFKLFGISLLAMLLLEGVSIPISLAIFRQSEIDIQTAQFDQTMNSLAETFKGEIIGGIIDTDLKAFDQLYDDYKDAALIPGTQECADYLEVFEEKEKDIAPMGMTQNGAYRTLIQNNLESVLIPTKSKYLYFGAYNKDTDIFMISCASHNTKLTNTLADAHFVSRGFFFESPYEFHAKRLGIEYNDILRGNLFVNAVEIIYEDNSGNDSNLEYWLVSETDIAVINDAVYKNTSTYLIISGVSIAILFLILAISSNFLFARRIRRLSTSANKYTELMKDNKFDVNITSLNKKFNDEIDNLNNDLYYLETELGNYVENLKKVIASDEKIRSELELSSKIQLASLPREKIFNEDIAISSIIKPAKEVGGDLYDYFYINEDKFAFLIGDVSGKGVPAALFMMKAKTLIKQALMSDIKLEESVRTINRELTLGNENNLFITAFVGIVDIKSGTLQFVNCGHEEPFIQNEGKEYKQLKVINNLPLGLEEEFEFKKEKIKLLPGDKIYLYTDGVSEAMDNESNLFTKKNILTYLNKYSVLPDSFINSEMLDVIQEYENGHEQDDDICMLSFSYQPSLVAIKNEVIEMEKVCEFVDKSLKGVKDEEFKANLNIVIDELLSNVVYYAYSEKNQDIFVSLDVNHKEGKVTFKIFDMGKEFNPFIRKVEREEDQIGGLGIELVKELSDFYQYERIGHTNVTTIRMSYKLSITEKIINVIKK